MPFTKAQLKQTAERIRNAQIQALKSLRAGENAASKEMLALLKTMYRDLKREVLYVTDGPFKTFHLKRLLQIVDDAIAAFDIQAKEIMSGHAENAMAAAREFWIDQFNAVKKIDSFYPAIPPLVSEESLSVIGTLSTELIQGLSDDVSKRLKLEIQRVVMGQRTPFEATKAMAHVIGPRGDVGAGAAADRIVRTEVNRAYSMTDELFRQENQDSRPADAPLLIKIWATSEDARVRPTHELVDLKWVYADEEFKVQIADKHGDPSGRHEMMTGPHDPKASAGNVVNCRCTTYTVPEYLASDFDATQQ